MRFRPYHLLLAAALTAGAALAQNPVQAATPVHRMAADAHPSFAVATIKPHDPNSRRQGWNVRGDRFIIENQTVTSMMMYAYSIDPHQVAGVPGWADNAAYDVEGITDTPGEANLRQQQEMIQKLLADRFQLKFHREKRELPVYAVRVAKGGPKLTPAANPGREHGQRASGQGTETTVFFTSASIADFILDMQFFLDRPLVDQTGLTGRYDITLRYTHDEAHTTDPNAPPGLFTAVQEQLGLKLDAVKVPIDVYVIDHVEKPSAN
jgi:uncharacterized protein (TIGR03435 family)